MAWKRPWGLAGKFKTKGCLSVLLLAPPGPARVAIAVNPFTTVTDAADFSNNLRGRNRCDWGSWECRGYRCRQVGSKTFIYAESCPSLIK